jgi:hypothetical protein
MPIVIAEAAIAAIKFLYAIGKKVSEVAVDEAVMSDLSLPRPRLPKTPEVGRATVILFFQDTEEGKSVLAELDDVRAAWEAWNKMDETAGYTGVLLPCYLSSAAAMNLTARMLSPVDGRDLAGYVVVKSYLVGQRPVAGAFQRILGEVVNQGLDFLNENPGILPVRARVGRILDPVIRGLADIDLAETPLDQTLLRRMLGIALDGLGAAADVSIPREGLRKLVKNLTEAVKDAAAADSSAGLEDFLDLNGPLLKALLKTAATTVSESPDLFLKDADWARGLLVPLATEISTIKGAVFSEETLCHLVAASVRSVGDQSGTLLNLKDDPKKSALAALLAGVTRTVADSLQASDAFSRIDVDHLLREVGTQAIEGTLGNLEAFLPKDWAANPDRMLAVQLVQQSLDAVAGAWKTGQSPVDPALLNAWMKEVFDAAASNLALRASLPGSAKKKAIYQLVGSVASSLAGDSAGLLSADGRSRLLSIAFSAFEMHAPVLLDLKAVDVKTNVLWSALQGTLAAASKAAEAGTILSERALLELCEAALQGAAKGAIAQASGKIQEPKVRAAIAAVLDLWGDGELDLSKAIARLPELLPRLVPLSVDKIAAEAKVLLAA